MRKTLHLFLALALSTAVQAQTMNVVTGDVTYQFVASQVGDMPYEEGTSLTVQGKTFAISDITKIYIDETEVTDNTVTVVYDGSSAKVTVAGNVAQYVTPTVTKAHVVIDQSTDLSDDNAGEITYTLSGSSTDGEFYQSGSYKSTIELNGLTLTNPSGAAINIQNGKRIDISVKKDTENTLSDGSDNDQKACLVVKGHTELKGKGTLNIYSYAAHGIQSGEYLTLKNCTLNILYAKKDGINCNEYFLQESGAITIKNVGDDGIQTDIDGDSSTGMTDDHEDEDSGNIYLEDGTLTIAVTATAAKGLKAEGDIYVNGGTTTASTTGGGEWDEDDLKTKAAAGMSSDGNIYINGGTLTFSSTGAGGKGISGDGNLTMTDGTISITTSGGIVAYVSGTLYNGYTGDTDRLDSDYTSSPKGIKVDGNIVISGGTISSVASKHEGMESKGTMNISGGHIYCKSSDDAINSGGEMTITGGYVCGYSTGNDGIDANGNCRIQGGVVYALGTSTPEVGIDANTEGGYQLYVEGGTLVAMAGLESGANLSQACYSTNSISKSTWYALYNNGELAIAFQTPSSVVTPLVVSTSSTPTLKSGVTISGGTELWSGMGNLEGTVSGGNSVSLSQYSGGGSGPGGGGSDPGGSGGGPGGSGGGSGGGPGGGW